MGSRKIKFWIFCFLYLFVMGIFVVRLADLQIVRYDENSLKADKNRIREEIILAPRGVIYDKNMELLVDSVPSFSVSFFPYVTRKKVDMVDFEGISKLIKIEPDSIRKKIKKLYGYRPITLVDDVSFETVSYISENQSKFPGVFIQVKPKRRYNENYHFLGYVRDVDEEDVESGKYIHGDVIGKVGLELEYEKMLKGKNGVRFVEMNARGKILGEVKDQDTIYPNVGNNLILTVDKDVQNAGVKSFPKKNNGAFVALDAKTGAVIAMASFPDYDNNLMTGSISRKDWNALNDPKERPLINRAVRGLYPPGSTLKPAVGLFALEEGIITKNTVFAACTGKYRFGNRDFYCWNRAGHGVENVIGAIEQSCNIFFYQLGEKISIDLFASEMNKFNFGHNSGIDLPYEKKGLVPDRNWYMKNYGKYNWGQGNLLNLSIGQGEFLATPLQNGTMLYGFSQ